MAKVLVLTLVSLVLSGCATTRLADAPPAHQAEAAPAPLSTTAAARILMTALPGWERTDAADGSISFRHPASGATLDVRLLDASTDTPSGLASTILRRVTEDGEGACVADPANGGTYALLRCERSRDGRPPTRGIVAIRRPSGRPDVLIVMSGRWPSSLDTSFDEGVDLMCLMATAE